MSLVEELSRTIVAERTRVKDVVNVQNSLSFSLTNEALSEGEQVVSPATCDLRKDNRVE